MGTAFLILQLIGGLMPIISQGILTVEQPGVPGAQKAAAVTDLALGTLDAVAPGISGKVGKNHILAGISAAITHLVAHFNATGQLPKTSPAPGAALGGVAASPAAGTALAGSAPGHQA